jgi:hypothetical protein
MGESGVMVHDFTQSLAGESVDMLRPETREILGSVFRNASFSRTRQGSDMDRSGIDVIVRASDKSVVTIDLKLRHHDIAPKDIMLEFEHRYHDGRSVPGWCVNPNKRCDLFGYIFKRDWSCYLLPRADLRAAWQRSGLRWRQTHGEKRSPNALYDTISCPVPIEEIAHEVRWLLRATAKDCFFAGVTLEDVQAELRRTEGKEGLPLWYRAGLWRSLDRLVAAVAPPAMAPLRELPAGVAGRPIEHWCKVCGVEAAWGYGVHLLAGEMGEWYCGAHRPDRPPEDDRRAFEDWTADRRREQW